MGRGAAYGHARRQGRCGNRAAAAAAPPATPPLDAFTNAPLAAYADWRRLLTSHTGNLNVIRKTTGGDTATTQGISYAAATNLRDTAAEAAFVGSESWAVVTRTDQTAGARNVTNATTANQPAGGTAGTAVTINGHHAADFDGSNDVLARADALGLSGAVAVSVYCEFQLDSVAAVSNLVALGGSGVVAGAGFELNVLDAVRIYLNINASNRVFTCPNLTTTTPHKVLVALGAGAQVGTARMWLDGIELAELTAANPTNTMSLGGSFFQHGMRLPPSTASNMNGKISEVIIWNADFGAGGNAADLTRALAL